MINKAGRAMENAHLPKYFTKKDVNIINTKWQQQKQNTGLIKRPM